MKRRAFIRKTSPVIALPYFINGFGINAVANSANLQRLTSANEETDRVLVLVQLNGGNDGLNTLIPIDQYANLSSARSNVLIPENNIIKLTENVGLHPSMTAVKSLYDEQKIGFVQGVGYPNPNLSHFRSTDIMVSASDADQIVDTGWLGRYLDDAFPGYPDGFPNEDNPDPLAITIGSIVSTTCQGPITNMGIAVNNNEAFYNLSGGNIGTTPDNFYGDELNFIRQTQQQTQQYLTTITTAAGKATNLSSLYPEAGENSLADQLKIVAQLIAGGLKTRVYVVSLGGFDTHAEQVQMGTGTTTGIHANLLNQLSTAIHAFQDDLKLLDIENRVVGMTFSEFGRRIKSNLSFGTDHGTSGPVIVFGTNVNPIFHGTNPQIPSFVEQEENLAMQFDFRSVYGSILKDWFNVEEATIQSLLFKSFDFLPIIKTAGVVGLNNNVSERQDLLSQNYPNPASSVTNINYQSNGGHIVLNVIDQQGKIINRIIDHDKIPGNHNVALDVSKIPNGLYLLQMQHLNKTYVKRLWVNK